MNSHNIRNFDTFILSFPKSAFKHRDGLCRAARLCYNEIPTMEREDKQAMNTSIKALERRSILLMVICAGMWSIGGIFIKLLPWNPLTIAGLRSLIASACMFTYMRIARISLRLDPAFSGVRGLPGS